MEIERLDYEPVRARQVEGTRFPFGLISLLFLLLVIPFPGISEIVAELNPLDASLPLVAWCAGAFCGVFGLVSERSPVVALIAVALHVLALVLFGLAWSLWII